MLPSKPSLNSRSSHTHALKDTEGDRGKGHSLHEIVQEVFVSVLVAGHSNILLSHHVVVGVVSLPRKLLALLRDPCLFLALLMALAEVF